MSVDNEIPDGLADSSSGFVQQLPALLLKEKQAAQVLALSERKLWDLADDGEIPVVWIDGCKRYRMSDLEDWVAGRPTGKQESNGA